MRGPGWCWHKWTKWGDVIRQRVSVRGQEGVADFQQRTCVKCNRVQEREVTRY